jgi:hypothetical protein
MCEENYRAYQRLIDGDRVLNQLSTADSNIHVIEQNTPPSIFFFLLSFSSSLL